MIATLLSDILAQSARFLVGGQARWNGSEPMDRQRIYFANHASHLDTILLWAALPKWLQPDTHPVAALDYWGGNAIKRYVATRILNAVLLARERSADPLAPLKAVLDAGQSLILFPEGTRSQNALPGTFKSGLFHLARAYPDVELIPVYLQNFARAYPKGAILPAPISCMVRFGPVFARIDGEDKATFLKRACDAVRAQAGDNHD